jgi:hypothetical protein
MDNSLQLAKGNQDNKVSLIALRNEALSWLKSRSLRCDVFEQRAALQQFALSWVVSSFLCFYLRRDVASQIFSVLFFFIYIYIYIYYLLIRKAP